MFIQRFQRKNTPAICFKKSFISNTDIFNGIGRVVNERKMEEFGDYLYNMHFNTYIERNRNVLSDSVYSCGIFFLSVTIGCTGNIRKHVQIYFIDNKFTNTYLLAMFFFYLGSY